MPEKERLARGVNRWAVNGAVHVLFSARARREVEKRERERELFRELKENLRREAREEPDSL
ncbi:hypothetical protein [Methylomagnum ishizawai]|uniref:hypothetical protein n=1 Tax=Methylomagnum ishizawai TaxID=1760988 RepID=UPI000F743D39|nr:hypothetical protein [Methylomagnum ishizawai]